MLDIHSHILPSFDDGSPDLETSLSMLRIAAEHGTTGMVATPHLIQGGWLPAWNKIETGCKILEENAAAAGINISIYPGAEVFVDLEILKLVLESGNYKINGSRYLLIELPSSEIPLFTDEFFFNLMVEGIVPILAHPERHPIILRKPGLLLEWVNKGILIQVNGPSILGLMGKQTCKFAEFLLTNNLVHCIGSDAHGVHHRDPNLALVAQKLNSLLGIGITEQLMVINPQNIINNKDVITIKSKYQYPEKVK